MPRPATIFVVRHGQRLDIADKAWHLTSPTPYDPPLTYGGWTQSRVLGTRIAGLLHGLEEEGSAGNEAARVVDGMPNPPSAEGKLAGAPPTKKRKKKHKIIIHSSPFLRCVQTSVAISAGIAQYRPPNPPAHRAASRSRSPNVRRVHAVRERSPRVPPLDTGIGAPSLAAPIENSQLSGSTEGPAHGKWDKTALCIDAFLGEWLNPEYFDRITPPPNSTMMVASAKAVLIRRGDGVDSTGPSAQATRGFFPGGWGSPVIAAETRPDPLDNMSTLGQALSRRDRASSHGSHPGPPASPTRPSERGAPSITPRVTRESASYAPPIPSYAISPDEPIPRGYCAHARDACVDIAYQWDSMREPQDWGHGGQYGEEWSAMHKRLRRGLLSMIQWYSTHPLQDPLGMEESIPEDAESDEDTELAIILVTHGAGCNALLGALMDQPILANVEMSSLSMAVRKEPADAPPASPFGSPERRSSIASGLSQDYGMQLIASTDHLRLDTDPNKITHVPSPKIVPHIPEYRRRLGSLSQSSIGSVPDSGAYGLGEPVRPVNSSLGSMRRASSHHVNGSARLGPPSTGSPVSRPTSSTSATSSTGLWSKPTTPAVEIPPATQADSVAVVDGPTDGAAAATHSAGVNGRKATATIEEEENDIAAPLRPLPQRSVSQRGLWGSGGAIGPPRDRTPKRRWTVTEREQEA